MQEQIFDLLLKEEEVTWKTILFDLVKTEQMNPWDVNVTLLTQKYIKVIKGMQEHNFRVSGKIVVAAAFLLKMKSSHLLNHDITNLDRLIHQTEEAVDEDFMDDVEDGVFTYKKGKQEFTLIPRNPQPRNRKVSIHDLVNALQRAMASKKRILERQRPVKFVMPERKIDIMEAIQEVYDKLEYYSKKDQEKTVTFSRLLPPKAGRQEKVFTFMPLLHLENQQKIETTQEKAFDEIHVTLTAKAK
jgi:segregation and condensation protein A